MKNTFLLGNELNPTPLRVFIKSLKQVPYLAGNYFYDMQRYLKHSSTLGYGGKNKLRARIIAIYHNVEKGLSLPAPRPGFGEANLSYLLSALDLYLLRHGVDDSLCAPSSALAAYVDFNRTAGNEDFPEKQRILKMIERIGMGNSECGGTASISKAQIQAATQNVGSEFFTSRYSIRQYSNEEVSDEDIVEAVRIAQKSPSVCNRQTCRVYAIRERERIKRILDFHGGTRGFGEYVNRLLVVTNKLSSFWGASERNQCWIDGGLFAMSLLLGLHSQGLGACSLNWSKDANVDREFRKIVEIADDEAVIMFVAVGHIPENLNVAVSHRMPVADVLCYD